MWTQKNRVNDLGNRVSRYFCEVRAYHVHASKKRTDSEPLHRDARSRRITINLCVVKRAPVHSLGFSMLKKKRNVYHLFSSSTVKGIVHIKRVFFAAKKQKYRQKVNFRRNGVSIGNRKKKWWVKNTLKKLNY